MNNSNQKYFGEENFTEKKRRPFLIFPWLVCLVASFAIWLYVMNVNTEMYEKTFTLIDISVEGAETMKNNSNLSVVYVEGGKLNVTVTGLRSDIAELTADDFVAYVDLGALESAGKHACEVKLKAPSTVSVKAKEPSSISVSVDTIKSVKVPIVIEKSSYSMSAEHYLGEVTTDIDFVNVKGPGGIVERIVGARAEIGLGAQLIQTSLTQRLALTLIDEEGKAVESPYVFVDQTSVTVNIPVLTDAIVPLKYSFADGYDTSLVDKVELSSATVKISGDPQLLSRITEIIVLVIDGEVATENLVNIADLLPEGVTVKEGSSTAMIKVTFKPIVPEVPDVPEIPEVSEDETGESTDVFVDTQIPPEDGGEAAETTTIDSAENV